MGLGRDLRARRKDGSEFPVEVSLSFIPEGRDGIAVAFVSDISPREQSRREAAAMVRRLEAALAEKTVLLQEVHHRVKNNLAVIASLLGMQADAIGDGPASRYLMESRQRVHSMALIHEHLYGIGNLKRVRLDEYAEKLASELQIPVAFGRYHGTGGGRAARTERGTGHPLRAHTERTAVERAEIRLSEPPRGTDRSGNRAAEGGLYRGDGAG